jgi:hypothetical protein
MPNILRNGLSYGATSPNDMLASPGIWSFKHRPNFFPKRSERVFYADWHFDRHLALDNPVSLQLTELLRKHLLRDPGHLLSTKFEAERLLVLLQEPQNQGLPTTADQNKQHLNRAHTGNWIDAHMGSGNRVYIWFLVSDVDYNS